MAGAIHGQTNASPSSKILFLPWLVCGVGALFFCYEFYLRVLPSVMTADLMRTYNINAAMLGNMTAFYFYAYTPMQLPVGVLLDRYGPRMLLTLACFACALGTYLFGFTDSLAIAKLGRFLVGFGSAFAFVGVLKLATIWLPPQHFAMIAGLTTTLGMLGAMTSDIMLNAVVEKFGWRHAVACSAIAGLVLTFIVWLVVRDRPREVPVPLPDHAENLKGAFHGLVETLKNRQVWLAGLIGFLMYTPTTAFAVLWGVPYLEYVYNFSAAHAGLAISMIFLGWAIGGPVIGSVSDKLRLRRIPMFFGALSAMFLLFVLIFLPGISDFWVFVILFLFGLCSSAQVIVFAIATEASSHEASGVALALTNMIVMLGGVLFQPLIGVLLDWKWEGILVNGAHVYTRGDFQFALAVLPFGVLVSVLLCGFVRETHAGGEE